MPVFNIAPSHTQAGPFTSPSWESYLRAVPAGPLEPEIAQSANEEVHNNSPTLDNALYLAEETVESSIYTQTETAVAPPYLLYPLDYMPGVVNPSVENGSAVPLAYQVRAIGTINPPVFAHDVLFSVVDAGQRQIDARFVLRSISGVLCGSIESTTADSRTFNEGEVPPMQRANAKHACIRMCDTKSEEIGRSTEVIVFSVFWENMTFCKRQAALLQDVFEHEYGYRVLRLPLKEGRLSPGLAMKITGRIKFEIAHLANPKNALLIVHYIGGASPGIQGGLREEPILHPLPSSTYMKLQNQFRELNSHEGNVLYVFDCPITFLEDLHLSSFVLAPSADESAPAWTTAEGNASTMTGQIAHMLWERKWLGEPPLTLFELYQQLCREATKAPLPTLRLGTWEPEAETFRHSTLPLFHSV